MRVKDYDRFKSIAIGLKNIVAKTGFGNGELGGSVAADYADITKAYINTFRDNITDNDIKAVYPIVSIDGIYCILVILDKMTAVAKDCPMTIDTTIGNSRTFDVRIVIASDIIFESVPEVFKLAKIAASRAYPRPMDYLYYVYCFSAIFKDLYNEDDLHGVIASSWTSEMNMSVDDIKFIINGLLDHYGVSDLMPDAADIARLILQLKSENTSSKTE